MAVKANVVDDIQFKAEVVDAVWDERSARWRVTAADGTVFTAKVFVPAPGFIGEARMPKFPGMDVFEGTMFHSGAWNHDHELTGERVAVIGSGASAIQFLPEIQPKVAKLYSFQRTPSWVIPKPDFAIPAFVSSVFKNFPWAQKAIRAAGFFGLEALYPLMNHPELTTRIVSPLQRAVIALSIKDPQLREGLFPDHVFGCKRPMMSNNWYRALSKPNVAVILQGIDRLTEKGVVAADGTEYEVDTVIFGTGYTAGDLEIAHIVRNGDGVTLADVWKGSPRTYMGLTINGFPNMFLMLAPNSQSHLLSGMLAAELQAGYITSMISHVLRQGISRFEVKKATQDQFNADIDQRLDKFPMQPKYCNTYYSDSTGRNHIVWPEWGFKIKRRLRRFDAADYHMTTR